VLRTPVLLHRRQGLVSKSEDAVSYQENALHAMMSQTAHVPEADHQQMLGPPQHRGRLRFGVFRPVNVNVPEQRQCSRQILRRETDHGNVVLDE
jgi:hypothetical protein